MREDIISYLTQEFKKNPHGTYKKLAPLIAEYRKGRAPKAPLSAIESRNLKNASLVRDRSELLTYVKNGGLCVELGVDEGSFSQVILDKVQPKKLFLVDRWDSDRYGEEKYKFVLSRFGKHIKEGRVSILRMGSVEACKNFEPKSVDFVYIDTDHSYETTASELTAYSNVVSRLGILAGHDYSMGNWITGYRYGVIEAVDEFCSAHDWGIRYLTANYSESPSFALKRLR